MKIDKYIIVSTIVTDDITQADGTYSGRFLGGAGIYALAGIRLWTKNAVIVTGIGEDFSSPYREWFRRNSCSEEGLLIKDKYTAISNVVYQKDGERREAPEYGGEHYRKLEAEPLELAKFFKEAKGVYIFKDLPEEYWKQILLYRKKYGFKLMWEINADVAFPEKWEAVKGLAEQCDVLSLNQTEAKRLFCNPAVSEIIEKLKSWKLPMIYLRVGAQGAYVITGSRAIKIPTEKNVQVIDSTGAGNSSSAAVLYGFCEGFSPEECGIMGSISAARCIEQYGPPDISPEIMDKAVETRDIMTSYCRRECNDTEGKI